MSDDWEILAIGIVLGGIVLGGAGFAIWNWGAVKWRERAKRNRIALSKQRRMNEADKPMPVGDDAFLDGLRDDAGSDPEL